MAMKKVRILQLKHVQERLTQLKEQDMVARPPRGWIRFIREALGMSSKALASRVGVSPTTMSETEKAEYEEGITLKRLRRVAESMDCDLVYYFLPKKPIPELIEQRARYLAEQKLREIQSLVDLDSSSIPEDFIESKIQDEVEELKFSKKLWD